LPSDFRKEGIHSQISEFGPQNLKKGMWGKRLATGRKSHGVLLIGMLGGSQFLATTDTV
jgi:hypothetical protein